MRLEGTIGVSRRAELSLGLAALSRQDRGSAPAETERPWALSGALQTAVAVHAAATLVPGSIVVGVTRLIQALRCTFDEATPALTQLQSCG